MEILQRVSANTAIYLLPYEPPRPPHFPIFLSNHSDHPSLEEIENNFLENSRGPDASIIFQSVNEPGYTVKRKKKPPQCTKAGE